MAKRDISMFRSFPRATRQAWNCSSARPCTRIDAMPRLLRQLVLASNNAGKLAELRAMLAPFGLEVVAQPELGLAAVEETGLSFVENAILKARHASALSGLPALAD